MSDKENKPTKEVEAKEDNDFADASTPTPNKEDEEIKVNQEALSPLDEQVPEFIEEEDDTEETPLEEEATSIATPNLDAKGKPVYTYTDERLQHIEDARAKYKHDDKKSNLIKTFISIGCLLLMVLGFVIPYVVLNLENAGLYIALAIAVVGVAAMGIVAHITSKQRKRNLRDYFNVYFNEGNDYMFGGLPISEIQGDVDSKITQSDFTEADIFPNVSAVGSRDNITFHYEDMECALAEAAAQKNAQKGLQTVFVGKYLRCANNVDISEEGLLIYFRGNERALPPENLLALHLLERNKRYSVYGSSSDRKVLTSKLRQLLKAVRTDRLLVDVAIKIKPGKTYFALGYEDDLMVLPLDNAFNPDFMMKAKGQLKGFFDIAYCLFEK